MLGKNMGKTLRQTWKTMERTWDCILGWVYIDPIYVYNTP